MMTNAGNTPDADRLDATGLPDGSDDTEELALIAAGFPAFSFWRTTCFGAAPRYIAQSSSLDSHPHTVVTDDLDELRTALAEGLDRRSEGSAG